MSLVHVFQVGTTNDAIFESLPIYKFCAKASVIDHIFLYSGKYMNCLIVNVLLLLSASWKYRWDKLIYGFESETAPSFDSKK